MSAFLEMIAEGCWIGSRYPPYGQDITVQNCSDILFLVSFIIETRDM